MGRDQQGRGSQVSAEPLVVRVRPDVAAVHRAFDYVVPEAWHRDGRAEQIVIGSRVRVPLHGRRVAGWVIEVGATAPPDIELAEVLTLSGLGPNQEMLDLADWVSRLWVAPLSKILRSASPNRNVYRLPAAGVTKLPPDADRSSSWASNAFTGAGAVVRIPPSGDRWPIVEAALRLGNPLFVVPSIPTVEALTQRLQRLHLVVAQLPDHWARAQAGAAVVGTRTAILGPGRDIGSIVVIDEHDDALAEERTPTWHAREVALERARRLGVPCVLTSATPSVEALQLLPLIAMARAEEFAGWATVEPIDRRDEPPGRANLFSARLVEEVRSGRRVGCVLNRRGRARLLACGSCGELAACETCEAPVHQVDDTLICGRCGTERPYICAACGARRLKNIRMGVSRAREELAALAKEPVSEVTASGWEGDPEARIAVGTEALLHRRRRWDTVVFLDFDQELLAMRQAASSQALGLLARASRTVGPRRNGGRVIVQTRMPDHVAIRAAMLADPNLVSQDEEQRRRRMGWPPFGAQAVVSGAGATTFVERLGEPLGISVQGPIEDHWLIRGDTQEHLAEVLGTVERPPERMRLQVNPSRL